ASADRGREIVDVAHERALDALVRLLSGAGAAGLEHRVLVLEGPAGLDLVVAEGDAGAGRGAQPGQEVAALFEGQNRVAGLAPGAPTGASVKPRGWVTPGQWLTVQPTRLRLPPYSGGP